MTTKNLPLSDDEEAEACLDLHLKLDMIEPMADFGEQSDLMFLLPADQFDQFVAMLGAPIAPSRELGELLTEETPWD